MAEWEQSYTAGLQLLGGTALAAALSCALDFKPTATLTAEALDELHGALQSGGGTAAKAVLRTEWTPLRLLCLGVACDPYRPAQRLLSQFVGFACTAALCALWVALTVDSTQPWVAALAAFSVPLSFRLSRVFDAISSIPHASVRDEDSQVHISLGSRL